MKPMKILVWKLGKREGRRKTNGLNGGMKAEIREEK